MTVAGTWFNELGSQVSLNLDGREISGSYRTGVGGGGELFDLIGMVDTRPDPVGQAFGFVISWTKDLGSRFSCVTSWTGQYQIIDGEEQLTTMWLLTMETESNQDWASTLVGHDIFRRDPPSEVEISWRKKRGSFAFPKHLHR